MRLLHTQTLRFVEINDPKTVEHRYAILSHTWDQAGEKSYQDLVAIQSSDPGDISPTLALPPSSKIRGFCAFAREAGYDFCWVDSCCIDKTSSSELTEAINSMYAWYGDADVCYAYLADVSHSPTTWKEEFRNSRWHQRAWTLQELIAPKKLFFLSRDWSDLGSKETLAPLVEDITGINAAVLMFEEPLSSVSVARRMSWAAPRKSTRPEDRAYSLFGIFDVQLPTAYGEGEKKAFVRLQEEVLRQIPDHSIFAWGLCPLSYHASLRILRRTEGGNFEVTREHSLLASSPRDFEGSRNVEYVPYTELRESLRLVSDTLPSLDCSVYPMQFNPPLYPVNSVSGNGPTHIAILACKDSVRGWVSLLIWDRSNGLSKNFSIGKPTSLIHTDTGDTLEAEQVRGTYITIEQTTILRGDVDLTKLQRKWDEILEEVSFSILSILPCFVAAMGPRSEDFFANLPVHVLCVVFVSASVVGLGTNYYLHVKGFNKYALVIWDADRHNLIAFLLLILVPVLLV